MIDLLAHALVAWVALSLIATGLWIIIHPQFHVE